MTLYAGKSYHLTLAMSITCKNDVMRTRPVFGSVFVVISYLCYFIYDLHLAQKKISFKRSIVLYLFTHKFSTYRQVVDSLYLQNIFCAIRKITQLANESSYLFRYLVARAFQYNVDTWSRQTLARSIAAWLCVTWTPKAFNQ